MTTEPPKGGGKALVLGSGIAGILACRALSPHFAQVVLIERGRVPVDASFRREAPQGRHSHVVLARGYQALLELLPGLGKALDDAGAARLDWTDDVSWLTPRGWAPRFPSRVHTWSASRGLLEWLIWERVRTLPGLVVREDTVVVGLAGDSDRVTGVLVEGASGATETLQADLVIDATGRGSRIDDWLEDIGLDRPTETIVDGGMGYATRWYQSTGETDWKALLVRNIAPTPTRAGLVSEVEDGKWVVTLAGMAGDLPRTDEEGFLAFARSLASPRLHEAIARAKPLGPVYGYRQMQNRRRHLERLARWPAALLVIGDALSTFNPFYAHGVTVAAIEAQALRGGAGPGLSAAATRRLQRAFVHAGRVPWLLATSEDARSKSGEGGIGLRLLHGYLDAVVAAAADNQEVQRTYVEVIHLLRSPLTFFAPQMLARVIMGRITQRQSRRLDG